MKSLGPSNDDSPEVQVEMRAAGLYAHGTDAAPPFESSPMLSLFGFANHERCPDASASWPPDGDSGVDWWAGWLLRELATHEARADRDATAWDWDTSRPIAGQYEEHIRQQHEAADVEVDDHPIAEQLAETAADDAAADVDQPPVGVVRRCGAEGVDEEGHCNRCGLVPDGDECPPGFFGSDGAL